eukprot:TRINITY_DN21588_c0_g1_i1.p1 TRINITY_DN21588_c0_g1~~TRINITY_DN21588_c0_g1_i1.p1  ORF type:complete len:530 (-),score=110.99 TRINITY_DN21588_c0_g1_i1:89-1678(-)
MAVEGLESFVSQWALNAQSQELLASLPPEALNKVIIDFQPRDTSRDVNSIFQKFASSIAASHTNSEDVESFIAQWGLHEEAQAILLGLTPGKRAKVMAEFNPRDREMDANNVFMKFATNVGKGFGVGKGKGVTKGFGKTSYVPPAARSLPYSQPQYVPATVYVPPSQRRAAAVAPALPQASMAGGSLQGSAAAAEIKARAMAAAEAARNAAQGGGGAAPASRQLMDKKAPITKVEDMDFPKAEEVAQFCASWGLEEEAMDVLCTQLDAPCQRKVIQEFNPRDTSSNVTGVFMTYARSVQAAYEANGKSFEDPRRAVAKATGKGSGSLATAFSDGDWNCAECGDHQFARNMSCRMCGAPRPGAAPPPRMYQPPQAMTAMTTYIPPSRTSYTPPTASRPAVGFLGGDWMCPSCGDHNFARNTQCRRCGVSKPAENLPGHRADAAAAYGGPDVPQHEVDEFVSRWALGPDAQGMLAAMAPLHRRSILQQFNPRDTSRDVNAVFMKFAQNMSRGQGPVRGPGPGSYGSGFISY